MGSHVPTATRIRRSRVAAVQMWRKTICNRCEAAARIAPSPALSTGIRSHILNIQLLQNIYCQDKFQRSQKYFMQLLLLQSNKQM